MIEVALPPDRRRPALARQKERIDPVALRRQHCLKVLESLLQILNGFGTVTLYRRRYGLQPLPSRIEPSQIRIAAGDNQFRPVLADGIVAPSYALQAAGGNAHLLDLVSRELQRTRGGVKRLLNLLL